MTDFATELLPEEEQKEPEALKQVEETVPPTDTVVAAVELQSMAGNAALAKVAEEEPESAIETVADPVEKTPATLKSTLQKKDTTLPESMPESTKPKMADQTLKKQAKSLALLLAQLQTDPEKANFEPVATAFSTAEPKLARKAVHQISIMFLRVAARSRKPAANALKIALQHAEPSLFVNLLAQLLYVPIIAQAPPAAPAEANS